MDKAGLIKYNNALFDQSWVIGNPNIALNVAGLFFRHNGNLQGKIYFCVNNRSFNLKCFLGNWN